MPPEPVPNPKPAPKKTSLGAWLMFFLVLGFLAWWWVPDMLVSYRLYMNRANDSIAKDTLKRLHAACREHWKANGPDTGCNAAVAARNGFQPHANVTLSGSGDATTFSATAQHRDSSRVFTVDADGNIQ